jgi:glycosyltransferase involved in cell wall biosynthesis
MTTEERAIPEILRSREAEAPPSVSIIIPAFNEEGNIERLLERIEEGIRLTRETGEIVFVDDGSSDGTWDKLERARGRHPMLRTFRHRRNLGLSEALNTGFRNVRGEFVIFLPADLQSDPAEDIPKIMKELEAGSDVVVGWRIGRVEGKAFVSYVYNLLSRRLFGVDAHDLNWIKGFRREVIDAIHLRSDWHRYMVVLAAGKGFRVKEIRTNYYPRHSGKSKFGKKRILRGVLDLLVVKFEMSFRDRPMLLFGSWGFGLFAAGFILGVLILAQKIATGVGSRPLLYLVMLLVSVGVQLVALGFIAEQIASMREAFREALRERREGEEERGA